uniref:ribosomal protein L14 n=1 Tax=Cephaleuros diffusus TaxID=1519597 RepID=UPI0030037798
MISNQSYLKVADNRGPKEIMVIHVINSQIANIGDKVVAVVKEALPNMTIKKSDIVTAVVV